MVYYRSIVNDSGCSSGFVNRCIMVVVFWDVHVVIVAIYSITPQSFRILIWVFTSCKMSCQAQGQAPEHGHHQEVAFQAISGEDFPFFLFNDHHYRFKLELLPGPCFCNVIPLMIIWCIYIYIYIHKYIYIYQHDVLLFPQRFWRFFNHDFLQDNRSNNRSFSRFIPVVFWWKRRIRHRILMGSKTKVMRVRVQPQPNLEVDNTWNVPYSGWIVHYIMLYYIMLLHRSPGTFPLRSYKIIRNQWLNQIIIRSRFLTLRVHD